MPYLLAEMIQCSYNVLATAIIPAIISRSRLGYFSNGQNGVSAKSVKHGPQLMNVSSDTMNAYVLQVANRSSPNLRMLGY